MGLKIYKAGHYNNIAEKEQYHNLCHLLTDRFKEDTEDIVFIGNFSWCNSESDAILIKNNAVVLIEFENYGGHIIAHEGKDWTTDHDIIIKNGIRKSPYYQIKKNRFDITNILKHLLPYNHSDFNRIQGLVVFHHQADITTDFSSQVDTWLDICDESGFIGKIEKTTSPFIRLSNEDIQHIVEGLSLSEENLDPNWYKKQTPAITTSNHIGVSADELYNRIYEIATSTQPLSLRHKKMFEILKQTCLELTRTNKQSYGNIFAMVDFLCKDANISSSDTYAIQTMRHHCGHDEKTSEKDFLYDIRALYIFIEKTFYITVPLTLRKITPEKNKPFIRFKIDENYIRCIVKEWNDSYIYATCEAQDTEKYLKIDYNLTKKGTDLKYIKNLLRKGMQINLLECSITDGIITPSLIIIEPDFLIDISSVARCFQDYGHHPLSYFVNRMDELPNSSAILLGNLAGSALDDMVHENKEHPYETSKTLQNNYKQNALKYSTCKYFDSEKYEKSVEEQIQNLRQIVNDQLYNLAEFDKDKSIIEPTFICEKLGLLGRVDLMTTDYKILIEQKSGRNYKLEHTSQGNTIDSKVQEDHYVQVLLYFGILHFNFDIKVKDIHIALLYSKYYNGLIQVPFYLKLFQEAIKFRNQVVFYEFILSNGGIGEIVSYLSPSLLNTNQINSYLWNNYQLPELNRKLEPLQHLSDLEKAYFNRMTTFVEKEQLLSKIGSSDHSSGVSDLWNMPLTEKKESGNIYTSLTILSKEKSDEYNGYDRITLHVPNQGKDFLPNFRKGDMVYLYSYSVEEIPDVRKSILFRGNLEEIQDDFLVVLLKDGQQHKDIIGSDGDIFAIEHSSSDISVTSEIAGLHQFISSISDRKDLLLGKRVPRCDANRKLFKSYEKDFNDIILKVKQTDDYFLLVGPPGTGKTSHALRFMVEEELSVPHADILLLSYTNRAVDEICKTLNGEDGNVPIPYLRLGQELSCSEECNSQIISNIVKSCHTPAEIKEKITSFHVFVSTTSTLSRNTFLFDLKHFSIAIIDEASQILEPDIIGILSAHRNSNNKKYNCIDKFVMIGDYKQLPAVVQQTEEESTISDPILKEAGFENCRQSLFERLFRWEKKNRRNAFIGILRKQGRMHPEIAEFPNAHFYFREHLQPVPLIHQQQKELYPFPIICHDKLDDLLQKRRMIFIASTPCLSNLSDKVNQDESEIVAAVLAKIYHYNEANFSPEKTVGVIVPYRNQIAMIRKEIEKIGINALKQISIDTVERYQGSQRDHIIYSFTVQHLSQIDFLTANTISEEKHFIDRKLNVAITRARKQMIMIGNTHILSDNSLFKDLIAFIRLKNGFIEISPNDLSDIRSHP